MARLWWVVSLTDLSLKEPLEEIEGNEQEKMGGEFRVVDTVTTPLVRSKWSRPITVSSTSAASLTHTNCAADLHTTSRN